MAIIRDDNEFKNKNVNVGGGASQLGGGYTSGGGSATGPQAGNVPKSSWTNIQEYLADPKQGASIAGSLAGDVETQGMDVQKGINDWGTEVGSQITQGTPTFTAPKDDTATAPGTIEYSGPKDPTQTAGYSNLLKGTQDVAANANALGSFGGIQKMLQGKANPSQPYSGRYDTLLAQGGGANRLAQTQAKYGNIGNQLTGMTSNLNNAITNAGYQKDLVNKQWSDYNADVKARADSAAAKSAQEEALKNMNAGIAQQWVLPGKETTPADLTKINQDVAAQNNANAFYAKQKADADAAAAKKKEWEKKNTGGSVFDGGFEPLEDLRYGLKGVGKEAKNVGGSISGGFKKLRSKF